jgi:uncharacterized phage-associated protein
MYKALDIAAWFLAAIDRQAGDSITHLKLQKLVYYAQAWSFALLDRPLFEEPVRAWRHGPAVDSVYHEFKGFGMANLPPRRLRTTIDPTAQILLEDILAVYGERSAHSLRNLTHDEEPWEEAWGDLPPESRSRRIIPPSTMRRYYRRQFEQRGDAKMKIDLTPMRLGPIEAGLIPLPPHPDGEYPSFPPDHAEFTEQVFRNLAAMGRRRSRVPHAAEA